MPRIPKVALPVALLFAALTLSACATKPKEVTAEPVAPVAVAAEKTPEPAPAPATVAEQPAPAPVVAAEQVAPKPVVKKAKKKVAKAKVAPPKVVAPEPAPVPVSAPAPEVKQEAPVAPAPVTVTTLPVQKAEPGFLEKYWLWLLGLIIAVIAVVLFTKKS